MTRRGLLGLLIDTPPVSARARDAAKEDFSLDAFYRGRSERGETTGPTLPKFRVRSELFVDAPETSPIGLPAREPVVRDVVDFHPPPPASSQRYAARIRPGACLAHLGTFCATCQERCPEQGAILVEGGKPRISKASCTGCGQCVPLCPAPSRSAIELYERAAEGDAA
jgi:Pyruvate/2-oxoacid:ferredoxin oxidoreductase delta subunit